MTCQISRRDWWLCTSTDLVLSTKQRKNQTKRTDGRTHTLLPSFFYILSSQIYWRKLYSSFRNSVATREWLMKTKSLIFTKLFCRKILKCIKIFLLYMYIFSFKIITTVSRQKQDSCLKSTNNKPQISNFTHKIQTLFSLQSNFWAT